MLELGALSLTLLDGSQRRGDDVCVGGVVGDARAVEVRVILPGDDQRTDARPSLFPSIGFEIRVTRRCDVERERGGDGEVAGGSVAVVHRRFSHRGTGDNDVCVADTLVRASHEDNHRRLAAIDCVFQRAIRGSLRSAIGIGVVHGRCGVLDERYQLISPDLSHCGSFCVLAVGFVVTE